MIEDGGDIFGDGVNVAARLEGLAEPGGICISEQVHMALGSKLPLEYEDLGAQEVKNIAEPVRAYQVHLKSGAELPQPSEHQKQVGPSKSRRWQPITATIVIILIVSGGVAYWFKPWEPREDSSTMEQMEFPSPGTASIAVLPFKNMSNDKEQEYFVDGMTDDLITDLSKLSGLFVIARNTVFTYKDSPVKIQQVAEDLGVRYVLEGSVRRTEGQIRINAQLIDATTGGHLWAERYDRQLKNIFAIQDEITANIVQALEIRLTTQEQEALVADSTINFDAYDLFLQGQRSFSAQNREGISDAINTYREVIKLDPNFSRAYGAMARALAFQYRLGYTETPLETLNLALEMAQKAVSINNKVPQAYWSLGYVQLYRKEYEKAVKATQRAIEISPNYADAYGLLAFINNNQGNPQQAIASITRGMHLNPYYTYEYLYTLGQAQYLSGNYLDAVENLIKALEKNETVPAPRVYLIASYVKQGLIDDAEWEVDQLQIYSPEITISHLKRVSAQKSTLMDELASDLRKAGFPE